MKRKILLSIFIAFLMCSGSLVLLANYNPSQPSNSPNSPITSPDTAPASSQSNTAYLNSSLKYYQNFGNTQSGSVTMTAPESGSYQTISLNTATTTDWTDNSAGTVGTYSYSLGNFRYWAGSTIYIEQFAFELGDFADTVTGNYGATLGTLYCNITIGGTTYALWNYNYAYISPETGALPAYYATAQIGGTIPSSVATGFYSVSIQFQATIDPSSFPYIGNSDGPSGGETETAVAGNTIQTSYPAQAAVNFMIGYTWSSSDYFDSPRWTNPSGTYGVMANWSSPVSGLGGYLNSVAGSVGIYNIGASTGNVPFNPSTDYNNNGATGVLPQRFHFVQTTNPNNPSITVSWTIGYTVEQETYTQALTSGQNPTENLNWWNSSAAFTLSIPSAAISGGSIDSYTWNNAVTWSVQHILTEYSASSPVNVFAVSPSGASGMAGISAGSPSGNYESISQSTLTMNTAFSLTYLVSDFINFYPSIVNSNIISTVNPLTPVVLYTNATEQISGEPHQLFWNRQGSAYSSTSPSSSEAIQSSAFSFSYTGLKSVDWYVHNNPNGNPVSGSALNTSTQSSSVTVLPFSLTPSPLDYSTVGTSVPLSLKFSTQTSATVSTINLTVNSVLENRFQPGISSGSVSYTFTQPVSSPLLVQWSVTDQYGYTQSITYQYGSNLTPAEYSNKVTVLQSPNATHSYPITLGSGVPSGTGFYQQLLTITNPSQYGINSADSNIQFTASNGSLLYAWIQSVNQGTEHNFTVWVKNYYGNSVIDMQVLPMFENLFSATGYLGEWNTTTDNGKMVFPLYQSWAGLSSLPLGWYAYGNSSDTIITYYSNHIGLRTTGNADSNPYIADVYTNFTLQFPVSLYSYMNFYMDNPGSDENQFGIVTQSSLPTRTNGYFIFGGYGGGSSGDVGINVGNVNTGFDAPNSNLLYELTLYNSTTNYLNVDGNSYSATGGGFSSPYYLNYYFNTNQTNFNIYYTFATTYVSSMPTISSIGTGSVFQANATTTSTFTGTSAGNYNSTYENMIYNIPISPNTNYVSILYNSTWTVSNIYPSTYLPLINNSNFVSIEDVSGFSSVQIELIEPNPFIGQSEPVSLSFDPSGVQFQTGDLNHVSYTPFGSSKTASFTTTQNFLQLPFGSLASVYVTNSWGQNIGSTGNFTVTQTNTLTINASVTDITMDPLNGTISTLYISINGYNVSVQPQLSFYLLNNSQYEYYATIPNGNSFPVYSGKILTNSPAQSIPVYGNAPEEGLTIYENAYNLSQSQLGQNNSFSSSPFIRLFIDGKAWQQGQTYDTFAGSVIGIRLETVLNQSLNFQLPLSSTLTLTSKNGYLNFTMPAFSPSYQLYVTTPSYVFGIINAEQVPATSPQATQHNNVSLQSNSSVNFKYETMVGQESEVYLLADTAYHFYTHDNITNTLNFTLSNNTYYVLNGQNITLYQIWLKEQQNQQNTSNAVTHLQLTKISGTGTAYPHVALTYKFQLQWQNGTAVSASEAKNLTYLVNLVNASSGSPLPVTIQTGRSASFFWFNFTSPASGQFDLSIIGTDTISNTNYPVVASQSLFIQTVTKTSVGMSESLSVPTAYTNQSFNIVLYFYYGNGTIMNETDTHLAINNTGNATLFAMSGNLKSVFGAVSMSYLAPGKAVMVLNISKAGTYEMFTSTSKFQISGSNVSASALSTFSVNTPTPDFWQSLLNGWNNFFTAKTFETLGLAIYHQLIIWIPVSVIIAVLYLLYRRIRTYIGTDKQDKSTIDLGTVREVNDIFSRGVIVGFKGLLDVYATLTENQKFAFDNAARGVLKAYPIVKYSDGKKIVTLTMFEVRNVIEKSMGNTKLKGYFNSLRAAVMTKKKSRNKL